MNSASHLPRAASRVSAGVTSQYDRHNAICSGNELTRFASVRAMKHCGTAVASIGGLNCAGNLAGFAGAFAVRAVSGRLADR
jgi:hypothetical protein